MSQETRQAPGKEEARKLYEQLRKLQEPRGCFFNADQEMALALLEQLLATKARYGYMACPCRFANGSRELDRDILCPCAYREQDMREYGSCFCGLYVSKEWNEGRLPRDYVPDRRPPEKIQM